jgi:NADPH-dependent 2,4-dienoyl-CoA reductase/sulfur reductase-like enzyme
MRLLIVGGSDAGISAALRAREVAPDTEVTVVVADSFPNYSICGLPFYLSGEVLDWRNLAHRTVEEIERKGIKLLLDHTAHAIDPAHKFVTVTNRAGHNRILAYDRLVIATGAMPSKPPFEGNNLPGVHLLHSMADAFRMQQHLTHKPPHSAVIVGAGYIGLEIADALVQRGVPHVTLVVRSESVLRTTLSPSMAQVVEDELRRHGITVAKGIAVESVRARGSRLAISGTQGYEATTDLVLLAVGLRPSTELAQTAGVITGTQGAICVNREMATNVPDIYAAGDCAETWHRLLNKPTYLPLGTTAHKQGRIAGENAVGGRRQFAGSLGTQVVKVFDLAVARTGLREEDARGAGFDPLSHELRVWDHKAYYPGARELCVRVTGDRNTGRLLGAQIIGHWRSEVAKRIDSFATALFHDVHVEEMNDIDLSYAPPFSSPWDPVQMSAQAWVIAYQNSSKKENTL